MYDLEKLQDNQISPFFISGFIHPCWNKLFKIQIIRENSIKFNEAIHISEDSLFCIDYLMHCKLIQILDIGTYHYFVDDAQVSLSKKVYCDIFEIYKMVFVRLEQLLERGMCLSELQQEILVQTIYPQIYSSVLKTILSEKMSWREKKKLLNSGVKCKYCRYVLGEEKIHYF